MKKNSIHFKHSLMIEQPREVVWDYTQNYDNRMQWDDSVKSITILQETPHRIVKMKLIGNTTMTMVYKLDERPVKTSLAARDIVSPIIQLAGGAWSYENVNGATLWTQTNTIEFKDHFLLKIMMPIYKLLFSFAMKKGMQKAKSIIENAQFY